MSARRVAIVHFQPIELYPPVLNDIRYFEMCKEMSNMVVFTTRNALTRYEFSCATGKGVIRRFGRMPCRSRLARYLNYVVFYARTLISLFLVRPCAIVYFETISSWPVLVYRALSRRKVPVLVHYHEITLLHEYEQGTGLERFFHRLERRWYSSFAWLSHTNKDRLDIFVSEHPEVPRQHAFTVPNYPPPSWKNPKGAAKPGSPARVVYIGALGLSTMYLREFAEWVLRQQGRVTWDIYSFNLDREARDYLESLKTPLITFKGDVDYDRIPSVLGKYDVGVILYKGTTINYVLNAPNKLFEYLSADLDVWLPSNMTGSLPYATTGTYPKVLVLEFANLEQYAADGLRDRDGLAYRPSMFYSETVVAPLAQRITALCNS